MAKGLYNDRVSCDYFDERAWCVVSQTYEKRNVLAGILMSLAANKMDKQEKERIAKIIIKKEEESIVEMEARLSTEIYQRLKRQRYLIVLDDVWASTTWDELYRYFPDDVNGSRVILTSRIKYTAPTGSIFHPLHLLSEVQCWDLLEKKVFFGEPCPSNLSCIGKAIAAKCHGLPLAVVVVSGFIAQLEKEENVWRKVEKSLVDSYIFDDQSGCLKILELSYEYLPNHLKLCFLYFGAFPEDEEIRTRKLVWLWIAEGFIPKQEEDSQETIAEQYLSELINRSLVMVVKRKFLGGVKACGLHDLLHDMCRRKAHDENFLKYVKEEYSLYERHQRLYVHFDSSQLRLFGLCFRSLSCSFKEPSVGLWHMPLLRVIDMMEERSENLNEIYHLVYLRYFAIFHMPKPVVNNLMNLEVLYLGSTHIKLSDILKMRKLRHLHSLGGTTIEKDCDTSHSQTTSLKSLGHVIIDNHEYGEILRRSPYLRKLNCSFGGTIFPDLHSLIELESLNMSYRDLRCEITEIWFSSTIKKLTLSEICLTSELISIIERLPNLQYLKLWEALKEAEWETKEELRFLILASDTLTQWIISSEHIPKLECLKLNHCRLLEEIPRELGDIPTLQTVEVNYSSYKASLSAVQMEIEQSESYGNEGLVVTINNRDWSKEQLVRDCRQTS